MSSQRKELVHAVGAFPFAFTERNKQVDELDLAMDLVMYGDEKTLNPASVGDRAIATTYAPVARFGALVAVTKGEIETFSRCRNLIRNYVDESQGARKASHPLSIAVFGPPGSGKSFTVREIAQDVDKRKIEPLEFNLTHWNDRKDLVLALTDIAELQIRGKIPLAQFDEFDCTISGNPLFWINYFLAPMEDGKFRDENGRIRSVGKAIFVFSGGTKHSFKSFSIPQGSDEVKAFRTLKLYDFLSRLQFHIDVIGLNRQIFADVGVDDEGHAIVEKRRNSNFHLRRAIVIRRFLKDMGLVDEANGKARVEEAVVYALLNLATYRHGTRSIRSVLRTWEKQRGRLRQVGIPSYDQLEMHVTGVEEVDRLLREFAAYSKERKVRDEQRNRQV
jgi:hypothetical protein